MARAVRIIDVMGVSEKSFNDAVKQAVRESAKTIDNITGVEVLKSTAEVDGDEIFEYHVTVRLAYALERDEEEGEEEGEEA